MDVAVIRSCHFSSVVMESLKKIRVVEVLLLVLAILVIAVLFSIPTVFYAHFMEQVRVVCLIRQR